MREALEAICFLSNFGNAVEIATDVLEQTVNGDSIDHDLELRETLLKLSDMLLGDNCLQKGRSNETLFGTLLHKLTLRQPMTVLRTHRLLRPKH